MIFELAVKAEDAGVDIDGIVQERAVLDAARGDWVHHCA
jgi:hypothetical protein